MFCFILIECVPSHPCSSAQTAKARQCASNPHGRPARLPPLLRRRGRRTHRHALAQGQRASAGQPWHRGQPSGPRFDPPGESADGRAYGQLQLPGGQLCRLGRHFLLCPSEGYVRERSRLLVLLLLLVCTGEHSHGKYALVRPQVQKMFSKNSFISLITIKRTNNRSVFVGRYQHSIFCTICHVCAPLHQPLYIIVCTAF